YIHTPIVFNGNNVGFTTLEVRSSIYMDVLNKFGVKNNINIFIADSLYSIKLSNNPTAIPDMQRELDNKVSASYLKDSKNDSFLNSIKTVKVIYLRESNTYAIKYLLFDSIYIMNVWRYGESYRENTIFRNTVIKSSISIYLGLLSFLLVILLLILSLRKTLVFAKNVSESLSEGEGDLTI
ncbi:methyl-accepting chemotaxis protein, partial [Brachyspira alvinipulli]